MYSPRGLFLRPTIIRYMVTKLMNSPKRVIQYVGESREELKKVHWPSREQTLRYTAVVIVASLVAGVVVGVVDYGLTQLLELFVL